MKAKKLIPFLSLTLCFSALAGCTDVNEKLEFNRYWNNNSLVHEEIHETLVYDVVYERGNGVDLQDYTLSYSGGTYKTVLKTAEENGKNIYVYSTELNITATYQYGTDEPAVCNDRVYTEIKFHSVNEALAPISSYKEIVSNSPTTGTHTSVVECFETFNYSITTVYQDGSKAGDCKIVRNFNGEAPETVSEKAFEVEEDKYSYLDNEQLLFALRGVSSSKTAANVLVYAPFVDKVQQVALNFTSDESAEFSFYQNGSAEKVAKTITYRPVTIVLQENNPGATQTAWIAKTTSTTGEGNEHRNVMLQLETPISYSLGSLVYKLNSVSYLA